MAGFNETPIFWTTTQAGYNDQDRTRRYMRNGKRVIEKLPQSGHVGDYNERRPARGTRYAKMIDSAGNEIAHTLTNAAAHMDPHTGYGQYARTKARALGWYAIGECPCALIATGEINSDAFLVDEIRNGTAQPCVKGTYKGDHLDSMCPHATAERNARVAAHSAHEADRAEKMKGKEDKIVEQQGEMLKYLAAAANKGLAPEDLPPPESKRARSKKDEE